MRSPGSGRCSPDPAAPEAASAVRRRAGPGGRAARRDRELNLKSLSRLPPHRRTPKATSAAGRRCGYACARRARPAQLRSTQPCSNTRTVACQHRRWHGSHDRFPSCLIATATPRELHPIARARRAYAPDAAAPAEWDFRWSSRASIQAGSLETTASQEAEARRSIGLSRAHRSVAWIGVARAPLLPSHGCGSGLSSDRAPADARSSSIPVVSRWTGQTLATIPKRQPPRTGPGSTGSLARVLRPCGGLR
jgi:hypothetical protein